MKPYFFTNARCLLRPIPVFFALSAMALGSIVGLSILEQLPALADAPEVTGLGQLKPDTSRQAMQNIAQEVVEKSFEDQFGLFNLFIIFFFFFGPLKVIPVFVQRWPLAPSSDFFAPSP